MSSDSISVPEWCWSDTYTCVVKVLKAGHYPDTVFVRMPDDTESEIYLTDLRIIS